MYLILYPDRNLSSHHQGVFQAIYTSDLHRVHGALQEPEVKVFRMDNLTQITDIKITYEEITKEMQDE